MQKLKEKQQQTKLTTLKSSLEHTSLPGAPALGGSCWLLEGARLTWARKKRYSNKASQRGNISPRCIVTGPRTSLGSSMRSPKRAGSVLVRHISWGLYVAPWIPIVLISSSLYTRHTKRIPSFHFSCFSLIYGSYVIIINHSCLRRSFPHPPTSLDWYWVKVWKLCWVKNRPISTLLLWLQHKPLAQKMFAELFRVYFSLI